VLWQSKGFHIGDKARDSPMTHISDPAGPSATTYGDLEGFHKHRSPFQMQEEKVLHPPHFMMIVTRREQRREIMITDFWKHNHGRR
jgi:hypothetical protein